jgi:hypothetical protein
MADARLQALGQNHLCRTKVLRYEYTLPQARVLKTLASRGPWTLVARVFGPAHKGSSHVVLTKRQVEASGEAQLGGSGARNDS